jgi:thiol:disulfide interchange protein
MWNRSASHDRFIILLPPMADETRWDLWSTSVEDAAMSENIDATESANRTLGVIVTLIALVVAFLAYKWIHPSTVLAADGRGGQWDAAVEHSHEAHMPSIVLFTADWCPACRALHSEVLDRSDVDAEITNHYTMLTVDLTNPNMAARERASKYGVSGIPLLIRFNADGKETDRTHFLPPDRMMTWLREGE